MKRDSKGKFTGTKEHGSATITKNGNSRPNGRWNAIKDMPEELRANRERILDIVANAAMSRSSLFKSMTDPRRNINHECGYPDTENLTIDQYRDMYDREAIAKRVVQVMPKECWQVTPRVFETESLESETAFEKSLDGIAINLTGGSRYEPEGGKGNPVWEYTARVDVLSGIGKLRSHSPRLR